MAQVSASCAASAPAAGTTSAVIVTYHPDADELRRHLASIVTQVAATVVVDNGSGEAIRATLRECRERFPSLRLIENDDNLGVATALNQAVSWAEARGFGWVLLFDQDSEPSSNILAALCQVYEADADPERIAIIGANYENRHTKTVNVAVPAGKKAIDVPVAITSGTLLRVTAFQHVGGFREDYFVDAVDTEYCLRLGRRGYRVLVTAEPLMRHELGESRAVRLGGRFLTYTNHSPLRRYYSTRNRLALAREYLFTQYWAWVLDMLRRLVQEVGTIILFESGKRAKLRAMLYGAWHFLRGRTGKLQTELRSR